MRYTWVRCLQVEIHLKTIFKFFQDVHMDKTKYFKPLRFNFKSAISFGIYFALESFYE